MTYGVKSSLTTGRLARVHPFFGLGVLGSVLLGVPLGTFLQLQQPELWSAGMYAACALAGLLGAWALKAAQPRVGLGALGPVPQAPSLAGFPSWLFVFMGMLAVTAMVFAATGLRATTQMQQRISPALEGKDLQIKGWIAELPRRTERGWSFVLAVQSATLLGQPVQVPPKVRLVWVSFVRPAPNPKVGLEEGVNEGTQPHLQPDPEAPLTPPNSPLRHDLRVGDFWAFDVRLMRPHGLSNPVGFDAELWMWQQGVLATGHVRAQKEQGAQHLQSTWRYPVQQLRQTVRDRVLRWVQPTSAAGVLAALVAGDQSAISREDWEVFRLTGVTHLVVVSGMHITLFAWMALTAISWFWRAVGRRWPALLLAVPVPVAASVGAVLLGGAYAVFSGWGVPAQRAFWMLTTAIVLKRSLTMWPWPVQWLAVFAVVLLWDPWAMLSAGFWLSFVAVGILFATATTPWEVAHGWRQQAWNQFRTQGLISVALAPLTLLWFGQFSVVGLAANLVAIPWVTMVVTPLSILGALFAPIWVAGGWAVQVMQAWLVFWAELPWASIMRPALPSALGVLTVLAGLMVVMRIPWSWRWMALWLAWPALVFAPQRPSHGEFEILAPDIGQGTAVLVRTQHHTLLYDTGPPQGSAGNAAQAVLIPLLQKLGDSPHTFIVSHADADHASGLPDLAAFAPQARIVTTFDTEPMGLSSQPCLAGQRWEWDGVPFEVLHPTPQDHLLGKSTNALSCVLRIGHTRADVLLTGDITVAEELEILHRHPTLQVHGLYAAHHGSLTSTSPAWLNALQPEWVFMQAGWRNSFGHPAKRVTDRLEARQIPWFNSPQCGALTWRSITPKSVHCHRVHQKRYWQTDKTPAI
jgi:competence protein ComEC